MKFLTLSLIAVSTLASMAANAQLYHTITDNIRIEVPSLAETANAQGAVCPSPMMAIETIQDALTCLDAVAIAGSATVTIALVEQPQVLYDTIVINHANGRQIEIIGDCPDGQRCQLTFHDGMDGVLIDGHMALGKLANLDLRGRNHLAAGVHLDRNATLLAGSGLEASGFYSGFLVHGNSNATFLDSNAHENSYGFVANLNSTIIGNGLTANDNRDDGFYSAWSSFFSLNQQSLAKGNARYGANVILNATFYCDRSCDLQNHYADESSIFYQQGGKTAPAADSAP